TWIRAPPQPPGIRRASFGDRGWMTTTRRRSPITGRRRREQPTRVARGGDRLAPTSTAGRQALGERRPRLLGEDGKGRRVVHGEVGEDLSIHLDAGLLEAVHEHAIAHVVLVRRGVDADDPEATELALFVAPVAVGVLPAALDVFFRRLPQFAARAEGAARVLHHLLLALEPRDVRLDPRHGGSP